MWISARAFQRVLNCKIWLLGETERACLLACLLAPIQPRTNLVKLTRSPRTDPLQVSALLPAAARRAIWSLYPVAPLFSLVAKIGEAEEDAFLLEEGLRCDDLEVKQTAAVAMASLMQARHKLGSKVPALKVTQAMKRLAEALLNSDLEESIPAGMAGIFQLWADKDRPDSDDTKISEAAEVLLRKVAAF